MAECKMTYFKGVRARGEIMRLVMAAAGKNFNENLIEFSEWPAMKEKTPFGSLPILEVDGKAYGEAIALAAYLARENGVYPTTNKGALLCDILALAREDMLKAEASFFFAEKEEDKKEKQKKVDEVYTTVLPVMEDFCAAAGDGFVADKKALTLADLVVFEGTQGISQHSPATLDKYPGIQKIRAKVAADSKIAKYLSARATTPM